MRIDEAQLKIWVVNKLFRNGYWGHRMLNFDDIMNPKVSRKELLKVLKELEREGLIQKKKGDKSSLYRYSLDTHRKQDIETLLMQ